MDEPDNNSSHPSAPPSTHPYAEEAQMTSALYLAGEALVAEDKADTNAYAVPENDFSAPALTEFDWLRKIVSDIRQTLAEDPRRAEMLRRLPSLLGNGEVLQVLFGNLFPEQRHQRKEAVTENGKKRLTQTQIEVLTHFAQGKTPAQIAMQRGCAPANINNILHTIEERLNTQSPQEAVAVAISMGHLPLDVMKFVHDTARCAPRDYSPLDCLISMHSLENLPDAAQWQELASFGMLLMLATNAASVPLAYAANPFSASGVLYRLEPEAKGAYRARQIVGPGRLRYPSGLVIAPHVARRQGFTPGHVYVAHKRAMREGLNQQEVMEFTPEGVEQHVFYGGRTTLSSLRDCRGMVFDASGRLLITSGNALQRFSEGGGRVQPLIEQCCTGVALAAKERLYLAHYSTRGGSIGLYTSGGKLRQTFAQLPMDIFFPGLQSLPGGEVAALRVSLSRDKPEEPMMQIYNAEGEFLRCWRAVGASLGAFAFHAKEERFYIPCDISRDIAVYAADGKLQQRIPLPAEVTPRAITFGSDGALWLVGSVLEA